MACQIKRNSEGRITNVTTPNGAKSKLFEAIHGNIFLADTETSVKILTNAYSGKVEKMFEGADKNVYDTGEPQLFYKAESGVEYDNLEDLIINEDPGTISMGFKNPKNDEFVDIATMTNKGSSKNEFLTSKVKEGLLSAERVLRKDGETRFQGKGEFLTTRLGTAAMVIEDLKYELGNGRSELYKDGTIEIEFNDGYSQVIDENGNATTVRTETIPEVLKENPNTLNKVELAIEYVTKHDNPRPVEGGKKVTERKIEDAKRVMKSLNAFLKSLGFSTATLEAYRKRYNTKYGKDPDIRAISDMANKIVAFREGKIGMEDLSEEVAHIAIEAYSDQKSITSALANVHLTEEYAEHAEYYRQKYAPHFKGVELEDMVRREVLGKILRNEFLTRFEEKNSTQERAFLVQKLRDIWRWITGKWRNNIKPYHRTAIDDLNKRIADSILSEDMTNFDTSLIEDSNRFFYSAMSDKGRSVEDELLVAKKYVEDLFRSALNTPTPNQAELDKLTNVNGELDILSSINTIVDIAQVQMDILEINAREAADASKLMSTKDTHRYEVLKNNIIPTINNLKNHLRNIKFEDSNNKNRAESIMRAGDEVVVKMSTVEPLIDKDKLQYVDEMVKKVTKNMSLTDKQEQELRDAIEGGYKDIGWLGKMFGLSSHSKNPVIQLLHMAVMKIEAATTRRFIKAYNPLITEIEKKGLRKYQKSIIHRDANGNATFYLLSPRDYAKYDAELERVENKSIAEITGKSVEEIKRLRDKYNVHEIIKDEKKYEQHKKNVKEWKEAEGLERRFTDAYYQQRDARFDKANVSEETRSYLSTKNTARYSRRRKYLNADGTIDLSKQTEAEKVEDRNDFKQHLQVKSPYDTAGNVKSGLRVIDVNEARREGIKLPFNIDPDFVGDIVTVDQNTSIDDLSIESRRALDLFNLDMLYRSELKEKAKTNKPIQKFMDKIKSIEAEGGVAYDWMISNASLGLSSEFYEGLGEGPRFIDVAKEWIDSIDDPTQKREKQLLLDGYIRAQRARKNLLKQNRRSDSMIEIDANHMTTQTRERLLELDEDIAETKRSLGVPFELFENEDGEVEGLVGSENGLNDDFYSMLKEFGGESKTFDFALKHMSRRNAVTTEDFARQIKDYFTGKRSYLNKSFDIFVGRVAESGMLDGKTDTEMIDILKNEFAKSKVASYFRRFQPEGFTEGLNALKNGEVSVAEFMENKDAVVEKFPGLKHVEISPEYSWTEDINNEEFMNPNYKSQGVRTQPKFLNEEFFKRYGIRKEDYLALDDEDLRLMKPTRNVEEYELLTLMTEMRQQSFENYGDQDVMNKYLRVQLSRTKVEKLMNIYKGSGANLSDMFTDIARSKIDEKEYGEEIEGTDINIKTIPKYFQQKLKDPSLISENTLYASMMDLKESIRFSERMLAERDVKALEHKIAHQKFKSTGGQGIKGRILKNGEVSNYYAKAQEMADYHLYGIRQNRKMVQTMPWGQEVDFTQWFQAVTKYARNVNLAFNLIADATSYTTGVYNNRIDRAAGDYYHKSSARRAEKIIANPKTIGSYVAESGKVKKETEFHHFLEFFNIQDVEEKLMESASNRGIRLASKSFFGASKVANLPVTPKNMYSIMFDHKYHEGRFKSFNDFTRDMRRDNKGMDKKAIEEAWNKIEDTFYEHVTVHKDLGVQMNDKFRAKFGDRAEEEFEDLHTRLMAKITHVNQSVDSIISKEDQIAAQRDFLTNALLLHRGWFIINLTRKFKGRHFNLATGQIEDGHYSSILNQSIDMMKALKRGEYKEWRNSLEEHEMRNLKRMRADALGIVLLMVVTNMLMAGDDDDDTVIENFAQLIALRTSSESQSQNIIGIPGTIGDIYEQPVVQLSLATNVAKSFDKWYKDGEINWKNSSHIMKNFLLYRRPDQLSDLQKQIDSYMYFNSSTLWGISAVGESE